MPHAMPFDVAPHKEPTVTIEINKGGSQYIFRINPHQPREIDRRLNKRGARWVRHTTCASEQGAVKTLFKLQHETEDDTDE